MSFLEKLTKNLENFESEKLSDKTTFNPDATVWAHTGCPELEYNLGILGLPCGIIEIAGDSQSGKSTLGLTAMKHLLDSDPNAVGIMLLSEERLNKEYCERIGVDMKRVFVVRSRFVEDLFFKFQIHLDEIEEAWKTEKLPGKPKIISLWDSVGATNSRAELDTFRTNVKIHRLNMEKGTHTDLKNAKMADFAKSAKQGAKAVMAQLYEANIIFICINHLIADINSKVASKKSTGGGWLEYMPTIRLKTARKEWVSYAIDGEEEQVGQITIVSVVKNDWGSRRKTEIQILRGYGIVLSDADVQYALDKGVLKLEGKSTYNFMGGKVKWSSPRTFYSQYEKQPKLMQILHKKIAQLRHADVIAEKNTK